MTNPRYDLAAARVTLRAAQDGEQTLKAIISGQAQGTNDTQRKAHTAELLLHSDDYQDALRELRAAEAAVDHAAAAVAVYEDDLRRAELAARERLAEALMGKRADNAVTDYAAMRAFSGAMNHMDDYDDALAEDAQGSYNGKTDRDFPF